MNHKLLVVFQCVPWLLLAACSSSQSPQASSGPPAVTAAKIGPCGGVTPAQAASILHIAASDVAGPQHGKPFSCSYRSHKDFYTRLDFDVYVAPSAAQAHEKLDAEKEGFALLSPVVAIRNPGDEAWYFPDSRARRLLMRKGAVWLDVTTPGDKASQLRVANIVLAHLP